MTIVKCSKCREKCSDDYEYCPNCGAKIQKEHSGGCLELLFLLFLIPFCARNNDEQKDVSDIQSGQPVSTTESATNSSNDKLSVKEDYWCKLKYAERAVCVVVENSTNSRKSYVKVEIDLFDEQNNLMATVSDDMNDLLPGQKWRFETAVKKAAVSYKIKDVISLD